MKRALISVSDKTNIVDFSKKLRALGYDIISTGGTLKTLQENNIDVIAVSEITGFVEIFDGRVKTLHPKIHGGLLYLRNDENHIKQAENNGILPIDLVVVNLYPFQDYVQNDVEYDLPISINQTNWKTIIENIDIGGPAMLRAGAKNFEFVTVLVDPIDYDVVLKEIRENKDTLLETRLRLATKVFDHVSRYDSLIAKVFSGKIKNEGIKTSRLKLRYGENPHQTAHYHQKENEVITQYHGKELSYNNLLDIDAAVKTIIKFQEPTVAILKHTNPCGIASFPDITIAFQRAFSSDTISPFGGIVITNDSVTKQFVDVLDKLFLEILIAPDFTDEALELLRKKKDRRIIKYHPNMTSELLNHLQIQPCLNGYLTQTPDMLKDDPSQWVIPTDRKPNENEFKELQFAFQIVKMLKSNAVCFTKNKQTIGLGIGQTSRIDSLNIAIDRSQKMKLDIAGSVCASDGFFPFRDSIDRLNDIGVKSVIQPGGSKADSDIITACNEHNIAMIITNRRHFRH